MRSAVLDELLSGGAGGGPETARVTRRAALVGLDASRPVRLVLARGTRELEEEDTATTAVATALGRGSRAGGVLAVARGGDLVVLVGESGSLAGDLPPRGPRRPRGRPVVGGARRPRDAVGPAAGLPRRRRRAAGRPARRAGAGGRRCRDGRARAGDVRGPAPGGSRRRTLARTARPVASQRVRTGGDAGGVAGSGRIGHRRRAHAPARPAHRELPARADRPGCSVGNGSTARSGCASQPCCCCAGWSIPVRPRLLLASGRGLRTGTLPSYRARGLGRGRRGRHGDRRAARLAQRLDHGPPAARPRGGGRVRVAARGGLHAGVSRRALPADPAGRERHRRADAQRGRAGAGARHDRRADARPADRGRRRRLEPQRVENVGTADQFRVRGAFTGDRGLAPPLVRLPGAVRGALPSLPRFRLRAAPGAGREPADRRRWTQRGGAPACRPTRGRLSLEREQSGAARRAAAAAASRSRGCRASHAGGHGTRAGHVRAGDRHLYQLAGTPEQMADEVRAFAEQSVAMLAVDFTQTEPDRSRVLIERFDREVIPLVRDVVPLAREAVAARDPSG